MASPASTFAWVGFILVNLGFAYILTSSGFSKHWYLGALLCGVYALCLIVAGYKIEKELKNIDKKKSSRIPGGNVVLFSWEYKSRLALLVDLLFAVGVLALGVTGFIVSTNVYSCNVGAEAMIEAGPRLGWVTNSTGFPEDVKQWYEGVLRGSESNNPSFTFFSSDETVLFAGKRGTVGPDDTEVMWQSKKGGPPVVIPGLSNPSGFCGPAGSTKCFYAEVDDRLKYSTDYKVVCSDDGLTFRYTDTVLHWPKNLYWSDDDMLWFIADPPERKSYELGIAYSLNPTTMDVRSYGSFRSGNDDDSVDDDAFNVNDSLCGSPDKRRGKIAMMTFFVGALPTFLVSVVLFLMEGISSLTVTAYLGLSGCVISLWVIFDGSSVNQVFDFFLDLNRYWFSWSSAVWLIFMCILVVIRRVKTRTFTWGVNASAIMYFTSMSILFFVADPSLTKEWVRFLGINFLVYIPLAALGVLYEREFLTLLGAGVGVLLDIIKGSKYLVSSMDSFAPRTLLFFLLFAVSGVIIGMIGWELSKRQESLQKVFFLWAQDNLLSFMPPEELMLMSTSSETTPLRSKSYLSLT